MHKFYAVFTVSVVFLMMINTVYAQNPVDVKLVPDKLTLSANQKANFTTIITNHQPQPITIHSIQIVGSYTDFTTQTPYHNIEIGSNSSLPVYGYVQIPANAKSGNYFLVTQINDTKNIGVGTLAVTISEPSSEKPTIGGSLDKIFLLLAAYVIPAQIIERAITWFRSYHLGRYDHREEDYEKKEKIAVLTKMRDKLAEKLGSEPLTNSLTILQWIKQEIAIKQLDNKIESHNKSIRDEKKLQRIFSSKSKIEKSDVRKQIDLEEENSKLINFLKSKGFDTNSNKSILDEISAKVKKYETNLCTDKIMNDELFDTVEKIYQKHLVEHDKLISEARSTQARHKASHERNIWILSSAIASIPAFFMSFYGGLGMFQMLAVPDIIPEHAKILDWAFNALFIGSGTKPIHDIIEQIKNVRK